MTNNEITRRLAAMDIKTVDQIRDMIALGYGGHGITLEAPATIKEVNAVFALVARRA